MQKKEIFGCVHTDNHQMILCIFLGQILALEIEKRNRKVSSKSSKSLPPNYQSSRINCLMITELVADIFLL